MVARVPTVRPSAPLRLLWLIDSLAAGGAEALTARFLAAGRRLDPHGRRLEVTVAFLKRLAGNPYEEELRALGAPPVFLDARHLRDLAAFRRLLELLRERRIDVVHAHLAYASLWGALAGARVRRPVVTTLHVVPPVASPWSGEGLRRLLRVWTARRRHVQPVAVSRAVAAAWGRETGLDEHCVRVIPNGVEIPPRIDDEERRAIRRRLWRELVVEHGVAPVDGEPELVLTVAVLRPGKGVDVLLKAAPRLLARRPRARLVIVGDGPERRVLERRLRDEPARVRGPAGRVAFLGFRRDVPELLSAVDLLALPSREDAYPTVLLEAAAAGLPAVASAVGGVGEIVVDGETGVLVRPEDPAALADGLADLLERPGHRRRLGKAARRRAEEEFSDRRWLELLEGLYRRLAGLPGPEGRPPRLTLVEPAGRGGLIHHANQLGRALAREGATVTLVTGRDYELAPLDEAAGPTGRFRVERSLRLWDAKPAGEAPVAGLRRRLRRVGRAVIWYLEWFRLVGRLVREARSPRPPDAVLFGDLRFVGDLVPLAWLRWRLARLPRPRRPALVDLCHNIEPFALGGRGAGRFGAGGLSRFLFRRLYGQFDRVVTHFEGNRRRFLEIYRLPPERVGAVPLGNGEIFHRLWRGGSSDLAAATLRHRLGLPEDAPVVLLFGSLAPYKGPDVAIEAFTEVVRQRPDARLVLAGPVLPGLAPEELRREIRRRGLEDAVLLEPGYVPSDEVAAWMGLATVAMFPYRQISQSAVVALAATFGVPAVATRVGAMGEMVCHGETGLLVPPKDPGALATALLEILGDADLRRRLGEGAHRFAHRELGWPMVAGRLLAELRAVVEGMA